MRTAANTNRIRMDKLLMSLLVVAVTVAVASSLKCVPCDQTTCVPPPPGCELGRRVCSCCNECRVPEGGKCGPFTAECESHLVCLTSERVYVGRPPWDSQASGTCIKYSDIPTAAPRIGRSILRRK